MGFLTTSEFATLKIALKSYKRAEAADAEFFSQYDDAASKSAVLSSELNVKETETLIKKLDDHILEILES